MITNRDVLHFSADDFWRSDPHSRHHLSYQFLKNKNRLFWVNSYGSRFPKISKKNARVFARKFKSFLKYIRKVGPDFCVMSPIALPLLGSKKLTKLIDYLLLLQIKFLILRYKIQNPIIFVTSPMFPEVIRKLDKDIVIYYYSDKYASYREITYKKETIQLDNMTLDQADFVFCAAKEFFDEVSNKRDSVFYLPHAVDFERFNGVLQAKTAIPEDMKHINKPIIGYFGSLTDSNDIDLIKYIALRRPKYSIVLIGNPSKEYDELKAFPNIYLLGRKDYEKIPLYGKYFDVCFMAWKMTEWIRKCSPLKTKEYLALGKPVVAPPIYELVNGYENMVTIAYDKEDFLKKIDENLVYDSPQKQKQRIEFIKDDTWEKRFMQMVNIIEKKNGAQGISI